MSAWSILTPLTFPHRGLSTLTHWNESWNICALRYRLRLSAFVLLAVSLSQIRVPSTLLSTSLWGPFSQRNCSVIICKAVLVSTFHINIQRRSLELCWLPFVPFLCVCSLRHQQFFLLLGQRSSTTSTAVDAVLEFVVICWVFIINPGQLLIDYRD